MVVNFPLCSSYIAQPAMSWIDDYFDWLKLDGCCRQYKNNHTFCSSEGMLISQNPKMAEWT